MTVPLPVPDAGAKVNQVALSLADHVKVPPPVLLRLSVCAAGLPPPWVAENEKLVGLAPMAGGTGAAITVSVTGTDCGVLVAPVAVIVIVPLYVPAVRLAVFTLTVTVLGAEPEAGLRVNHAALSLTDQLMVPPPVFVMLSVWLAGFKAPCVPVKVKLVGFSPIVSGAAVTVRVTGTVCGVLVAPVALRVMMPL